MRVSQPQLPAHPASEIMALYSRGDLSLVERLRVRQHLSRCAECEHQALLFESSTAELKREAATETLTAFEAIAHWDRLEADMLGNIAVGVAAARCIQRVRHSRTWLVRAAFASGLAALFAAGWISHIPNAESARIAQAFQGYLGAQRKALPGSVVRTTPEGIAVHSQGVTLTILHPRTAMVSLSGNSSLEARFVDEDSGQVTIANVYGQ